MFVEPELTDRQAWLQIDGDVGPTYVPYDEVPLTKRQIHRANLLLDFPQEVAERYRGVEVERLRIAVGYGVRTVASGGWQDADATPWSVFAKQRHAEACFAEAQLECSALHADAA